MLERQFPEDAQMQEFVRLFSTARCRDFTSWWPEVSAVITSAMEWAILGEEMESVLQETDGKITMILERGGGR